MRVLLLLVLAVASSLSARAQDTPRPRAINKLGYVSGTASLELNGVPVGALKSVSGGNAVADVVTERPGPSGVAGKHLANVRYEPIVLEVGASMAPEFWAALQQWPTNKPFNGAVLLGDFNQNIVKRLEFNNAIITEIGLPALDAAGREAFTIQVTLTPSFTKVVAGSGKAPTVGPRTKTMTVNNFRLTIDGVDTTRVNKIDSFVLKQKVASNPVGEFRLKEPQTAAPEVGDLIFTVPEASASSLEKWFDSFVIQGNREEKAGKIEMLGPDLKTVVFSISLRGLGIYRLAPEAVEAGKEAPRTIEARLYVESATIDGVK